MEGIFHMYLAKCPILRQILAGAVLWAVVSGAVSAQPLNLDEPASSPAWWSLTDALSPAQLKEAWSDPQANIARYKEAMAQGLAPPRDDEFFATVTFYYQRSELNPELTPMSQAFNVFGGRVEGEGRERTSRGLSSYGISASGVERILEVSRQEQLEVAQAVEETGPKQVEFGLIMRQVLKQRGLEQRDDPQFQWALDHDDYRFFAEATGVDPEHVAELMAAYRTSPGRKSQEAIVILRGELTHEDWQGLRRYLLEVVSASLGPFVDYK